MRPTLHVHLESQGIDPQVVRLTSLEGSEVISQLFDFELELATAEPLAVEDLLAAPAALVFARDGEGSRRIFGMIAEVSERVGRSAEVRAYRVRMTPRHYALAVNQTLEIYMDKSVPDIVTAVLESRGFEAGKDFELRLTGSYAPREFVVQYRESDLDFVTRIAEHVGIAFHFEHEQKDKMVFTDHNDGYRPIAGEPHLELRDRDEENGVFGVAVRTRTLPARVVLRDYNYRTPQVDLTAMADVEPGGFSDVLEYGAHFKTPDEGKALALVRAEELRATRTVYEADSVEERVGAGTTFTLEGYPAGDLELLVTEVRHHARQAGHFSGRAEAPRYKSELCAIAKKVRYRPPRRIPKPRVDGLLTGVVDASAKGPYAELDGDGRYKVKFLFDTADASGGQASRPVRMAQPHAGGGYGMHFPLRSGVEVVLSFVNGDPDRPIIAGTVANPGTPGPVTSGNAQRNIIRTGGGNEINIDDTDGSQRIKLTTPRGGTTFQLGSPNGPEDGGFFESAYNYSGVVSGVQSTLSATQSSVTKLASLLSKGSIVSVAEAPKIWQVALDFIATDLPEIIGGVASTIVAAQGASKAAADRVVERAENEQKKAKAGLSPTQLKFQADIEEAQSDKNDAQKKKDQLDAQVAVAQGLAKVTGQPPSKDLLTAQQDAADDLKEKQEDLDKAKKARDAAIPSDKVEALDNTAKAKYDADQEAEIQDAANTSGLAKKAAEAMEAFKAYAGLAKTLISDTYDMLSKLSEAKEALEALAKLVEAAGTLLTAPRVSKLFATTAPSLPVHVLGSASVTHVYGDKHAVVSAGESVSLLANEILLGKGAKGVVLHSAATIEAVAGDRVLASTKHLDLHGRTEVVIGGGTTVTGKQDAASNSVRISAQKKALFESNEADITIKAKAGVLLEAGGAGQDPMDLVLVNKLKDLKLKAEAQNVFAEAKLAFEAKAGADGGAFTARLDAEKKILSLGKGDATEKHGLKVDDTQFVLGHGTKLELNGSSTNVTLTADLNIKSGAITLNGSGDATVKGSKVLLG